MNASKAVLLELENKYGLIAIVKLGLLKRGDN